MDSSDKRSVPESPARVFLVEDNPEHSFIAAKVLYQLLGEESEIIVVENADEALYLLHRFTEHDRPDLILVDLRLPDSWLVDSANAKRQACPRPCAGALAAEPAGTVIWAGRAIGSPDLL